MRKTALITGGAIRIGRALAIHLAGKGWDVAIHFNRSEEGASRLASFLTREYPDQRFETFRADLLSDTETGSLVARVIDTMGKPFLLINNASVFEPATILETATGFLDEHMAINFRAPFILVRDFARQCSEGVIINFTDTRISGNASDHAVYTLSKKALWELTKMAALELGPEIRVNAIAPGLTLPPAGKDMDYLMKLAANIPMKRPGGINPVLESLDFILENEYLTGQMLFCDGGENLGSAKKKSQ